MFDNSFLSNYLKFSKRNYNRHFSSRRTRDLLAKIIKNLTVSLQIFDKQINIANLLSAIDEKIKQTQQQIEKAEKWKKGLLQKMFV